MKILIILTFYLYLKNVGSYSVAIGNNLRESKVVQFIVRFIKTARKRGKRLIVVTTPSDGGVQIQNLSTQLYR